MDTFSLVRLLAVLRHYPTPRRYWVALSGGIDSSVLLHAMAQLRAELGAVQLAAIHVNHGLSPNAGIWSGHCEAVCRDLGVACRVVPVEVRKAPDESPEAAARRARYRAFETVVGEDECLLTAQHRDDQAETLLLQLLRGAGVAGLAAMPHAAALGRGRLLRPLLDFGRAELQAYAETQGLAWVEDESNLDVGLDRNYLRHVVLPRIGARWPGAPRTLARAAGHMAQACRLLDALALIDLDGVAGTAPGTLSVPGLSRLDTARRGNLVRFWLRRLGLPMPPTARLQAILDQVLNAAPDRNPRIAWRGAEVHRYRGLLHGLAPLPAPQPDRVLAWDMRAPLDLPYGCLESSSAVGRGLDAGACERLPVTVRFRRGGERCTPAGSRHSRELKTLFQEYGVPPWLRGHVPLVYLGASLAAVGGLWVCEPFQAGPQAAGRVLRWERSGAGDRTHP